MLIGLHLALRKFIKVPMEEKKTLICEASSETVD